MSPSFHMSTRQHTFKAGETIFKEGQGADSLFLIKAGQVSIRKKSGDTAVEIGQAGLNQIIGELAFFDRQPRSADAIALSSVELMEIPFTALDPIFGPAPDYLKKIMISLAARLRAADDMIRDLKEQVMTGVAPDPLKTPETDTGKTTDYLSEMERVLAMTEEKKQI